VPALGLSFRLGCFAWLFLRPLRLACIVITSSITKEDSDKCKEAEDYAKRENVTVRAAMKRLREQGKNSLELSRDILHDCESRAAAMMIITAAEPIRQRSYVELLERHATPQSTAVWTAELAAGSWQSECCAIFATTSDLSLAEVLEFPPNGREVNEAQHDLLCDRATLYFGFCLNLVSYRVRSQSLFSTCFPDCSRQIATA
jgi:hypothetical protein